MNSYVTYDMEGFNMRDGRSKDSWALTLIDNKEHTYESHAFLQSVHFDEHLTRITFTLKDGESWESHKAEISLELERICFNLISRVPNIPVDKPICRLREAMDDAGHTMRMRANEYIMVHDDCFAMCHRPADSVYDEALNYAVAMDKRKEAYQEIFCILQCSDRVIQFLGLYDMMAKLICEKYPAKKRLQARVMEFFGKNMARYNLTGASFKQSSKGVGGGKKNSEDPFTHLRNNIAHSMQIGVDEYLKQSRGISFECIQALLRVINDLLCEAVTVVGRDNIAAKTGSGDGQ